MCYAWLCTIAQYAHTTINCVIIKGISSCSTKLSDYEGKLIFLPLFMFSSAFTSHIIEFV